MAGEDALGQGRARAGQADDENRPLAGVFGRNPACAGSQPLRMTDLRNPLDQFDVWPDVVVRNGNRRVASPLVIMERFLPSPQVLQLLAERVVQKYVSVGRQVRGAQHRLHLFYM